ncbi:MAG: hypothetical protein HS116_24840 [Planctomycetes bacterium]|nr:hypothetical protein [Planctomycetota bacterium]
MPANSLSFVAREGLHNVTVHLFRRRLPDGPLWYRFWLGGKKYSASTGHVIERDARSIARTEVVRAIESAAIPGGTRDFSLDRAIARYLEQMPAGTSHGHRKSARLRLAKFAAAAGPDLNLAGMTADQMNGRIQEYLAARANAGRGAVTIRNDRLALSGLCSWLLGFREPDGTRLVGWTHNPAGAKLAPTPRIARNIKPPLSDGMVERLLELAKPTVLYPAAVLMVSGCRPIGVDRLVWADFDAKARTVTIFEKGQRTPVPLSRWAVNELAAWRKSRSPCPPDDAKILPSTRYGMDNALKYLRQATGLPDEVTWGALRRYADFKLYQAGVSPQAAGAQMRHSPSTAQRHYVDWKRLTSHETAEVLSFGGGPKNRKRKAGTKSGTRTGT